MRKIIVGVLSLIFTLSLAIPAFADSFESASNLFIFNGTINEDVNSNGDVYALGNNINLKGKSEGDIIVAGSTVNINTEKVSGNIRTIGYNLDISSNNVRNITAIGSRINISNVTEAKGVYLAGADINFYGKAEDLRVIGETVIISGKVTGNLQTNCENLIIEEGAEIAGEIKVKSPNEPIVKNNMDTSKIIFDKSEISTPDINFKGISVIATAISIISSLLISMVLVLICKNYLYKTEERVRTRAWLSFVIGFATLIVLPIVAVFSLLTVVAIPISAIALVIYGVLIYLSPIIAGIITGRLLFKNTNIYLSSVIGTITLKLVLLIPYVRGVIYFACMLFSLGTFTENLIEKISKNN